MRSALFVKTLKMLQFIFSICFFGTVYVKIAYPSTVAYTILFIFLFVYLFIFKLAVFTCLSEANSRKGKFMEEDCQHIFFV